ncbi:hypothetical protein CEXT_494531 [Caerostris extrusa]|uniref:Uncharacterized protein n=1 Tax=Caerostris extrusa TaxID=172846 RepID=A0AAV4M809_CAEEX|nr:hypothetical protein CEXT_494531 [Caerostris extrusa]
MCFRSPLVHSTCQCDSWCDRHSFLSEFWLNPSEPQRQGMQKSVSNSAHIPTVELKKKKSLALTQTTALLKALICRLESLVSAL